MSIVDRILVAYEELHVQPVRNLWYRQSPGRAGSLGGPDLACGLGILATATSGRRRQDLDSERVRRILHLSSEYILGFMSGFDRGLSYKPSHLTTGGRYRQGLRDGAATWKAARKLSRRWARGETPMAIQRGLGRAWAGIARGVQRVQIARGLAELGTACITAAQEDAVVTAGLAAARALVTTGRAVPACTSSVS